MVESVLEGTLTKAWIEACERLYKLAKKKGERTTSYDSERSAGENVGYGSRHDRTHFTLQDDPFTIKTTMDSWVQWNPTADWNGTTRELEVLCNDKMLFKAVCEGVRSIQQFTPGDERYAGSESQRAKSWELLHGSQKNLPSKYLNATS